MTELVRLTGREYYFPLYSMAVRLFPYPGDDEETFRPDAITYGCTYKADIGQAHYGNIVEKMERNELRILHMTHDLPEIFATRRNRQRLSYMYCNVSEYTWRKFIYAVKYTKCEGMTMEAIYAVLVDILHHSIFNDGNSPVALMRRWILIFFNAHSLSPLFPRILHNVEEITIPLMYSSYSLDLF